MSESMNLKAPASPAQAGPAWVLVADMVNQPKGWYWSTFPSGWCWYSPAQNGARAIDYGDLNWYPLLSDRYWGPFTAPPIESTPADSQMAQPLKTPFDTISVEFNDTKFIDLGGDFTLMSATGPVKITRMGVWSPSYIPDVLIETADPIPNTAYGNGMDKNHLCRDQVFLDSAIAHLRTLGYTGEGFGRGELGAQGHYEVSMEPGSDFDGFAKSRGWQYAGDLEGKEKNDEKIEGENSSDSK